ncbi:hypothetical protein FRC10_010009 [Ceratobasidium sp. 414]|nr:hypothetical protein FRC10_010009 [Ceratobasidium sp. 414]
MFGTDFIDYLLPEVPTLASLNSSVNTVYSSFEIDPEMKLNYTGALWTSIGFTDSEPTLPNAFSDLSISVFENFALILWSAILLDFGVASGSNILTDINLFEKVIHSGLWVSSAAWSSASGSSRQVYRFAPDIILKNPAKFNLPFTSIQPTSFNARYVCRNLSWKNPTNLVVDVLVATVTFFTTFWAALMFCLSYVAVKQLSPYG